MAEVPTDLFITEVTHQRPAFTKDASGGTISIFETIGTFNGRLQGPPASDNEGAPIGTRSFYDAMLYCAPDEDVQETDRLIIAGNTWDVEGANNSNQMDVYLAVRLKRSK